MARVMIVINTFAFPSALTVVSATVGGTTSVSDDLVVLEQDREDFKQAKTHLRLIQLPKLSQKLLLELLKSQLKVMQID